MALEKLAVCLINHPGDGLLALVVASLFQFHHFAFHCTFSTRRRTSYRIASHSIASPLNWLQVLFICSFFQHSSSISPHVSLGRIFQSYFISVIVVDYHHRYTLFPLPSSIVEIKKASTSICCVHVMWITTLFLSETVYLARSSS